MKQGVFVTNLQRGIHCRKNINISRFHFSPSPFASYFCFLLHTALKSGLTIAYRQIKGDINKKTDRRKNKQTKKQTTTN